MRTGTVLAGRYRIEGLIAEGGLAAVYRARHLILDNPVAVKVLSTHDNPDLRRRLMREGRVQASLGHPNVVSVFDVVEHQEGPALVMEYLGHGSLYDLVRAKGGLRGSTWAKVSQGILAGVAAAHHHGIVHRDLKPSNILIDRVGDAIVPKVMDFGLAKAFIDTRPDAPAATRPGSVFGTPPYMSPEQTFDASAVDARSDVFSLGVLLYALVLGNSPFNAPSDTEVFGRIRRVDCVPLKELALDLPPALVEIVHTAMRADPMERYPTAGAMLKAWIRASR